MAVIVGTAIPIGTAAAAMATTTAAAVTTVTVDASFLSRVIARGSTRSPVAGEQPHSPAPVAVFDLPEGSAGTRFPSPAMAAGSVATGGLSPVMVAGSAGTPPAEAAEFRA